MVERDNNDMTNANCACADQIAQFGLAIQPINIHLNGTTAVLDGLLKEGIVTKL